MSTFFYGLSSGLSLIVAVGAQNAFVLQQGLKRQYIFWVCLLCALSDSILIYIGITGFGTLEKYPLFLQCVKYFGVLFLIIYGLRKFYAAFYHKNQLNKDDIERNSLVKVLSICFMLTWFNPHNYLDTIVLLGAISVQFKHDIWSFYLGAVIASWSFFFLVGYGSRFLLPLFVNPITWRIVNFFIAIMMWYIAFKLLTD